MYADGVVFSASERERLSTIRAYQAAGLTEAEDVGALAGTISVPDITAFSNRILLHFQLPARYPDAAAHFRLELSGSRCEPRFAGDLVHDVLLVIV